MSTVAQIIQSKDSALHSITADIPISEALGEMARLEVDGLVVMEGPALVGIFTSNDYLRKVVNAGLDAATLNVGDVMTRQVAVVDLAATSAQCVAMMSKGRFRHLPVIDGSRIVGVVSMLDIMSFSMRGISQDVGDDPGWASGPTDTQL